MRLKDDGLGSTEYRKEIDITKIDLHFQIELEHCARSS